MHKTSDHKIICCNDLLMYIMNWTLNLFQILNIIQKSKYFGSLNPNKENKT